MSSEASRPAQRPASTSDARKRAAEAAPGETYTREELRRFMADAWSEGATFGWETTLSEFHDSPNPYGTDR